MGTVKKRSTPKRRTPPARTGTGKVGQPRDENQTPLGKYLDDHDITREAFAKRMKVTVGTINRFCRGVRRPTIEKALLIEEYTDGVIPVSTWKDVHRTDKGKRSKQ